MNNGFIQQQGMPAGNNDDDNDNFSSSSDDAFSTDNERGEEDELRSMVFGRVGARPQFQVVRKTTIREEGPRLPALFRVEYRGGRIIEGTLAFINRDLGDRIAAITDGLIRDQTINWEPVLQKIRLQMQQQQQQHNGH